MSARLSGKKERFVVQGREEARWIASMEAYSIHVRKMGDNGERDSLESDMIFGDERTSGLWPYKSNRSFKPSHCSFTLGIIS